MYFSDYIGIYSIENSKLEPLKNLLSRVELLSYMQISFKERTTLILSQNKYRYIISTPKTLHS